MIHRVVTFALRQRFLILMLAVLVAVAGAWSFARMPVDAYPDVSPPRVEIVSQWPGHAAEEVERLVTLPIEIEMTGTPDLDVLRSISLYGLSDVKMTFEESTDALVVGDWAFFAIDEIGDLALSFHLDAHPVAVSRLTRFLVEHDVPYVLHEAFTVDDDDQIVFESDTGKQFDEPR